MSDDYELPEITVTSTATSQNAVRQPRGVVQVNGTTVTGWESFTVTNNSFYEADTFTLKFSATALPQAFNAAWFSNQTETFIEIFAGFPANVTNPSASDLTSYIYGRIDDLQYDPISQILTLTGRDLTGALIDAKVSADYANKTASKIATILANNHGLTPQVTETSVYVGSYYQNDTMKLQLGSEWDLLAELARQEGFVTFVNGHTLYFGPDQTGSGNTLKIKYTPASNIYGSPQAPVMSMGFSRAQTVVKGISVIVLSAGRKSTDIVKYSYPTSSKGISPGKSSPYGPTTIYQYRAPAGTTPLQAQQLAESYYNQIIQHAMKAKFSMPADVLTGPTSTIVMSGTGTAFDQTYYPRVVTRTMSVDEGYTMDIDAQSNSPNLTPVDPAE